MEGFSYLPERLDAAEQAALLADILGIVAEAPFYRPTMPRSGKPMSVLMTNAGPLGWLTDKEKGYRYQAVHPETGRPWPAIPQRLLDLWAEATGSEKAPEACLVNYYAPGARMGLHQDKDEADFTVPVLSVSLGDSALFRVAPARKGPSRSMTLKSGDVVVLAGKARLSFHGIDRVLGGSSRLLGPPDFPQGGRINVTLRRVSA